MKHSFARRATKLPLISLLLYILLSGCNRGKENQLPKSTECLTRWCLREIPTAS